jgi:hypothetical protein
MTLMLSLVFAMIHFHNILNTCADVNAELFSVKAGERITIAVAR